MKQTNFKPVFRSLSCKSVALRTVKRSILCTLLTGLMLLASGTAGAQITKTVVNAGNPAHLYLVNIETYNSEGTQGTLQYVFGGLSGINRNVLDDLINSAVIPYKGLLNACDFEGSLARVFVSQRTGSIPSISEEDIAATDWSDAEAVATNELLVPGGNAGLTVTENNQYLDMGALDEVADEYEVNDKTVLANYVLDQTATTEYLYVDDVLTAVTKIYINLYQVFIHCIEVRKDVTAPATVTQSIALQSGVNWISTNVTSTDPTLLNQVKTSLSTVGQQIKANGNKTLMKSGAAWIGTVTSLSEKEMYQVTVKANHTLTVEGLPVNPENTSIALAANGWSWLGYTPAATLPVSVALTNINTQEGDQIKSQYGYAQYTVATGWVGSGLENMEPGKGYMYLSNAATAKTFTYPNAQPDNSVVTKSAKATVAPRWTADRRRFADNMTVTAIVLDRETEIHSDLLEIAAFVDGECRGSALLQYVEGLENPYPGFLMISGEAGDRLTFKVYDHGRQAEYNASSPVKTFASNGVYGNPLHPSVVTLRSTTGIDRINSALRIYPNPVKDVLYIEHGQTKLEKLEIFDINGKLRHAVETGQSIPVSHLAPGIYLLKITLNGETSVHKFIKQF